MPAPKKLDIPTADGVAPCWLHRPAGDAKLPGVVMFPDVGSVRPASHEMAQRLADLGYAVLLPHSFYRLGDYPPFDPVTVWTDPPELERLMKVVRSIDHAMASRDADRYISALLDDPGTTGDRVGTVGYCIGGKLAFLAAGAHPGRVAAAASIHGGALVGDGDDSPHLAAGRIEAQVYIGIADEDRSCTPAHQARLVEALATAHVRFTIDHFKGRRHGFAMKDFPVYDEEAGERHWARITELFADALPR